MKKLYILDPTKSDKIGAFRGGGRILQLLKENLPEAVFLDSGRARSSLARMTNHRDSTLLIPSWNPFMPPITHKPPFAKASEGQANYLIIFDAIPIKYPSHFPIGIRGRINLWRNKQALKHFDKIITISETSKKDLIKYLNLPESKIEVIYPCLAKNFLPKQKVKGKSQKFENLNIENSLKIENCKLKINKYCLYVGDVNWNKNLVALAKAIKLADVNCVFVGKQFTDVIPNSFRDPYKMLKQVRDELSHPWMTEFKQFLEEVGDDPRFIFPGYINDDELLQLYNNTVCNLLVSRDEGFGMSYIEAGSQGCPSVLSDIPVFHEIAQNNAIFADPNNPRTIAGTITKLFTDNKLRNHLGQQTQKHILSKYSPINFKNNLLKILNF